MTQTIEGSREDLKHSIKQLNATRTPVHRKSQTKVKDGYFVEGFLTLRNIFLTLPNWDPLGKSKNLR